MIDIKKLIPQRPPFLMIDTLEELKPGEMAKANKLVTINEWFFKSGNVKTMTMPNTLLVEALAQTGAAAILSAPDFKGKNAFFGGIRSAEFSRPVKPGDQLSLRVEMTKMRGKIGTGHGVISNGEEVVCEADLTFIVG